MVDKFSEAIRLGGMLGPQIFGQELGGGGFSCAFGGAVLAAGLELGPLNPGASSIRGKAITVGNSVAIPKAWRPTTTSWQSCPVCSSSGPLPCLVTLAHLNDFHRWSRDQIADWVKGIEDSLIGANPQPEGIHANQKV